MAHLPTSEVSDLAAQIGAAILRAEAVRMRVDGAISDRSEGSSSGPPPVSQLDRGFNLNAVADELDSLADNL